MGTSGTPRLVSACNPTVSGVVDTMPFSFDSGGSLVMKCRDGSRVSWTHGGRHWCPRAKM